MSRALEASRGRAIEAHRSRAVLTLVHVAAAGALLGIVLGAALAWTTTGNEDRYLAGLWLRREVNQHLNPAAMIQAQQAVPVANGFAPEAASPDQVAAIGILRKVGLFGVPLAILLAGGLTTLLRRQWIKAARDAALDQVLRGNRVATPQELASLLAWTRKHHPLKLGGVPIPPEDEVRHLLAIGKSGSGKTTALRSLVRQIAARGEHMLVFDPDGSYVERFYDPARGDIILNVWDARSARWNPFDDIANLDDAYRVASVLVTKPAASSENAVWYDQARAVVANIMHRLLREGRTSLDDLAATLTSATIDDMRALVAGTEAARAFEPGAEKASSSVAFMLTGAARLAAMLASVPATATPFSFDAFYATLAERTGPKPLIFLAAPRRYREAGAPLVTAWIDAAASAILQRQIDTAPNAWLMLDELASLPPINSLLTLFPEGRKHGAAIVIAFQSVAQLQQRYGPDGVHVVTGQTATQLVMAVGDHPTAKWAVDLFGSVETQGQRSTETLGTDKDGRGSLALHRDRNTLVLDSEVTGLAVGQAYLRLSGLPIAKVVIDPGAPMPVIAPAWTPAPVAAPTAIPDPVIPTPAPVRIEDGDDWLTAGPI